MYSVPPAHRLHPSYSHPLLQQWQTESPLQASDLIFPIFVQNDISDSIHGEQHQHTTTGNGNGNANATNKIQTTEIASMPGQFRWVVSDLPKLLAPLVAYGLRAILLFGVCNNDAVKDTNASFAAAHTSPVLNAIRLIRQQFPSLFIMTDVCLCAYTSHGHCGILDDEGRILNDRSNQRIAEVAVEFAKAGAHCVAPSDMMDGRIGMIKHQLEKAHLASRVSVCSYSVKFASCLYGPFRDAASSGAQFGDRKLYQLPPTSRSIALRACDRDVEEGADFLIVKPGNMYLDLIRECRERTNLPIAAYQTSGEFAMIYHAAKAGAFTLKDGVMESVNSIKRAGAKLIISYFTPNLLVWLHAEAEAHLKGIQQLSPDLLATLPKP